MMLSKNHTKYIQSLHHKKFRDQENVFIAEGSKVVMELLQSGQISCNEIIATENWLHQNEMQIRKYFAGPLIPADQISLQKISLLSTPPGVFAVFLQKERNPFSTTNKITLLLDEIKDPGNLGTIIRIADWYGIPNIVCSLNSADSYNPKVVQSTMGSLARVNLWYDDVNNWLPQNKVNHIYAAALNGEKLTALTPLHEAIIIIGNESKGISNELMELATQKITIPKYGAAESLNAAVATGIILSHLVG